MLVINVYIAIRQKNKFNTFSYSLILIRAVKTHNCIAMESHLPALKTNITTTYIFMFNNILEMTTIASGAKLYNTNPD